MSVYYENKLNKVNAETNVSFEVEGVKDTDNDRIAVA